jgi:membrane protease YdiL (CAAX protease family)
VTPERRLWAGIAAYWLAAAAVVAALGPGPVAALPTALAAGAGILAGGLLFVLLARRLPSAGATQPVLLAVLVACATAEELVWRRFALAGLAARTTAPAALVASSCGFAFAHGRLRVSHLVGGALFGTLYLVTGGLVAPVCAHAAYNVAVAAGTRRRTAYRPA